jgi:plastocyanin
VAHAESLSVLIPPTRPEILPSALVAVYLACVRRGAVGILLLAAVFAAPGCALAGSAAQTKTPARKVTTVTVLEYEFGFKLSRQTVPAGKVRFVMANSGAIVHNFDVIGVKVGPFLVSGQRATMTVTLRKGSYTYVCSVKYHASQGMQGTLLVT